MSRVVVVGIGNAFRSDDAVGLRVAAGLLGRLPQGVEVVACEGEPTRLLEVWEGADAVVVVDAIRSGADTGAVRRIDLVSDELPDELFRGSTHHFSLADTVRLARALGRLPRVAVLYGIEGGSFAAGEDVGQAAGRGAAEAAELVVEEVARCTSAT